MFCADPRKTMGTLQINIGSAILPLAVEIKDFDVVCAHSYVLYWGSVCFIIAGVLSYATVGCRESCLVNSALLMNVLNVVPVVVAGIAIYVDLEVNPVQNPQCINPENPFHCAVKVMCIEYGLKILPFVYFTEFCASIRTFVLIWKAKA